ncbi:MAG: hypothetical protein LUO86_05225, partial [Methanomicrobiales archaeon]|nr:hypothetical protein [Methanomicrobiales archaeon]
MGVFNRIRSDYWNSGDGTLADRRAAEWQPGPWSGQAGKTAMRSAIILVGGEARRAGGQEKYF